LIDLPVISEDEEGDAMANVAGGRSRAKWLICSRVFHEKSKQELAELSAAMTEPVESCWKRSRGDREESKELLQDLSEEGEEEESEEEEEED
jgi:hypothetical protein